jgi:MFS transporter, UMF1 family
LTTQVFPTTIDSTDERTYRRRVWAWTMYDWANSAFVTTIMAAVLPIYFSQVAGATLSSPARATAYWSAGLSISLLLAALVSPVLGTVSDIIRGKKPLLAFFTGLGVLATALLVLVETGDWVLASILAIVGRIGFSGANVFYDALLPHVARKDDQDRVSARGYAMGYLGGGILLAINAWMILAFPGTWGARLSFLSVAVWWAVFSIPLFRHVPEPPAAVERIRGVVNVTLASFARLWDTLRDLRQYRELFKYLIAFLLYVDGIGTIIGVAAIYGAELGFGALELILALLLVQFVGVPYSLIFGRLPQPSDSRRPLFLAFIIFSLIALPIVGIAGSRWFPAQLSGAPPPAYVNTATAVGQGNYPADDPAVVYSGRWQSAIIPAELLGTSESVIYRYTDQPGASYMLAYNGQTVQITYSSGPNGGIWGVELDGQPLLDPETGEPLTIDAYSPAIRYGITADFSAGAPGEHQLLLTNTGLNNTPSQGTGMNVTEIQVFPPSRQSSLVSILGLLLLVVLICFLLALVLGKALFSGLARRMDTKNSILLALVVYAVIAVWGYFLNSVIEFWFLAWMVAVVQGGSQALSRSLFSVMSPSAKSGEFFGLFGIMEKFSGVIGPLVFAFAAANFGSSRPAILSIVGFFILGGFLLTRVNVEEGKQVAQAEDTRLMTEGYE